MIGEFPLNGTDGNPQYGVDRKDFLLLFKAKGTTQEPQEIELLGVKMTDVHPRVESTFFTEEEFSLEFRQLLLVDGQALIDP